MTEFYVSPGYPIPIKQLKKGCRSIDLDRIKDFWNDVAERDKRGCYIFALKVGRGFTPYYVGQAAKQPFQAECLTAHKLAFHYCEVLNEKKGLPYLFFVVQKKHKGKWSRSAIGDVEEHLIAFAAARNPGITNKRRLPNQTWSIRGVIASEPGAPTEEAKVFKRLMAIT